MRNRLPSLSSLPSLPSLPTLAATQTVASAGLVTAIVALAMGVALAAGAPVVPLAGAVVGGILLAIGIRWLGTDRALPMLLGGVCVPLGIAAWLGGVGIGVDTVGLVGALALGAAGVTTGLGWTGLLVGSFTRSRVSSAVTRYLLALFGLTLLGGVGVLFAGGAFEAVSTSLGDVSTAAIDGLTGTDRPVEAAGPTLLLFGAGFVLLRRASERLSAPYLLAEETREQADAALEELERVSRILAVVLAALGMFATFAAVVGIVAETGGPLRIPFTVVGMAAVRWLALGLVLIAGVTLLVLWASDVSESLSLSQVVTAVFPLIGLLAGGAALVPLVLETGAVGSLRQLPVLTDVLTGIEDDTVVALLVAGAALFTGGVFQTGLHILYGRLPKDAPAVSVIGVGLTLLTIGVTVVGAPVLVVVGLLVLTLLAVDTGRYGATLAAEIGRRQGLRTEFVHGTAGVGIGGVCAVLGWGAATTEIISVPSLSLLSYLIGITGLVVVLFFLGRQLSA